MHISVMRGLKGPCQIHTVFVREVLSNESRASVSLTRQLYKQNHQRRKIAASPTDEKSKFLSTETRHSLTERSELCASTAQA